MFADVLTCFSIVVMAGALQTVDYSGAQVLRLSNVTLDDFADIETLESLGDLEVMAKRFDSCDILLLNDSSEAIKEELDNMNMSYEVIVEDVEETITKERLSSVYNTNSTCSKGSCFGWNKYYRLTEIYKYLNYLQEEFPHLVTVETIGLTAEQRPIKVVKISSDSKVKRPKAVWVDGGVHAREWITPAAAVYIAYHVANSLNKNYTTFYGLNYYILPVVNPDGYEFSHTTDRFWRKNRSINNDSNCIGTDLNRNWGYHWGGRESHADPCSSNYRGSRAFSELETSAVSAYILNTSSKIKAYLSLHSYGQNILFPWAYTYFRSSDFKELYSLAYNMSYRVQIKNGINYKYGTASELYYIASGGSQDWAKGKANIEYTYTMELRDTGKFGFSLPVKYILETSKDALVAFTILSEKAKS